MGDTMKDRIFALLARSDNTGMHAIGRALVGLYRRQTIAQQTFSHTNEENTRGFNKFDSFKGMSDAKYYLIYDRLRKDSIEYWQSPCKIGSDVSKIQKYWRQLIEISEEKRIEQEAMEALANEWIQIPTVIGMI